jgi:late competence protein required for DNA uptake (superfamily II DNA/RNA helicase)
MKFHKGTREEFLEDMQTEFPYASLRTELTKYQERFVCRYCSQFTTQTVVCYCHYCPEGLLQGGVDGRHLADLVFP